MFLLSFTTDLTDYADFVLLGEIGIKKFVAFPGLTPLQPGSDVHSCKQVCLLEHPHLSGLPC